MKAYVVEDCIAKKEVAEYLLKSVGITEVCHLTCTVDLVRMAYDGSLDTDLLIMDLGLPRFDGGMEDSYEGYRTLLELSYREINIPTIVYSGTYLRDEQVELLKDLEFPYLGRACDENELSILLNNFVNNLDGNLRTLKDDTMI